MVKDDVVKYIKKYRAKYSPNVLRGEVIKNGYTKKDFDEAIAFINQKKTGNLESAKGSFLIGLAGWSGIGVFLFILLSLFLDSKLLSFLSFEIGVVFLGLISLGYYALGKKHQSVMLRVMSLIFLFFIILLFLFRIITYISPNIFAFLENSVGGSTEDVFSLLVSRMLWVIILFIIIILVIGVLGIMHGVALLKLKTVTLSVPVAILEIVGFASLVLLIGAIVLPIAFILGIIMFFIDSKKKAA